MKSIKIIISTVLIASLGWSWAYAQVVDRSKAPAAGEVPSLNIPAVSSFTLSNGLPVYFLEKKEAPLIQLTLTFKAGSSAETMKQLGLASLTAKMMTEGAGKRDALELADEIDFLGINLSVYAGRESSGISLFTPSAKFDPALALVKDILTAPAFPEKELERRKKELIVSFVQAHDEPRAIAGTAYNQFVFGKNHPFGRTTAGNETTIKALTVNDVKAFHAAYFAPDLAYAVVAGDIRKDDLKSKLETAFRDWKPASKNVRAVDDAKPTKGRTVYIIDKPGSAQTEIRVGCVGVKRSNPDYYAITVMNTILGGSFTSRLNNNLREQKGYTYGAFSRFGMFLSKGAFTVSTSVQTEVTDKALTEIMKELKNIRVISDEDLSKAKNYVALSYPADFEGVQNMVSMIDEKIYYGLLDSYFNDYTKNILAVTMDDVKRAVQNYIQPENMAIVLVGDRAKIESGVKALKLGKLVNLKREDVLGKIPKI